MSKYIPLKPLLHFELAEVNTVVLHPTFKLIDAEHCQRNCRVAALYVLDVFERGNAQAASIPLEHSDAALGACGKSAVGMY